MSCQAGLGDALDERVRCEVLRDRLRSTSASELAKRYGPNLIAGGAAVPADVFVRGLAGAQVIQSGPGRYAILAGGRPVLSVDGKRVEIEVGP